MGSDRSLLVTGAGGQLGKALTYLRPDGVHLPRSALDITDRAAVLDAVATLRPHVIINAAGFTKVDAAEADPRRAFEINAEGVGHLAEAAMEAGSILVQVSTDYVFRGDKKTPYKEEDDTDPLSVYGKSKLAGERAAAQVDSHLIVRTSWMFGQGHNFLRSILLAARSQEEIAVVDDQMGLPTYAPHVAQGLLDLLDAGGVGIYHLASGGEPATWADLAELALKSAGLSAKVRRVGTREYYAGRSGPVAPRPANSVLECSKAASVGVRLPPWPRGVVEYLEESE